MAELTLGSLFDGLGGWQLAALHNGVRPIWSSEIEAFPMAVTKKHFPDTLQLGDITKLDGAIVPPVDIICAGSPCQGLSISGKGKGLSDERSGLFRKAIDIVRGMRTATNGEYPKFFIWENVPGAFSTNQRHDFQAVLEEITETKIPMPVSGQWAEAGMVRSRQCDVAWRVLDAQYWGVPQRRKRIFLIADFRDQQSRNTAVLFEPESVPGNTAPGGNEGQGTAAGAENNIGTTSSFEPGITARDGRKLSEEASTTLRANMGDNQTTVLTASFYPNNSEKARGIGYQEEKSATLRAEAQTGLLTYMASNSMQSSNPQSGCRAVDVAKTLDTSNQDPAKNQGGIAIREVYTIAGNTIDRQLKNGANGKGVAKDVSYTLNTIDRHAVTAPQAIGIASQSFHEFKVSNKSGALKAKGGVLGGQRSTICYTGANMKENHQYAVDFGRTSDRIQMNATQSTTLLGLGGGAGAKAGLYHLKKEGDNMEYIVRRLTPIECERLQGLPDRFTDVECNGKPASDTARYKAIGNGMAQPCADFVLGQVVKALTRKI